MSFLLAEIFCGMPPSTTPSHSLFLRQPFSDHRSTLPLIQPKNPPKQDAETLQPLPGSSSLQHQAQCLQVIHQTNQQFHQRLKAEHLYRKKLQLFVLQLQNDFDLLRYLLFSSVGTIPISDNSVKSSATSPLKKLNANPISTALLLPSADAPTLRHSTLEVAVGPPKAKPNNSANADFQFSTNTREAPPITAQNITSSISKLEKLFADETAICTSKNARIHSQYFSLYDNIRQLEAGNSDAIIWKIPSVKFAFDSAEVARPSSDPLTETATSFCSLIFRTHPHGYNFCQILPLWYWIRYGQVCINFPHPLPWWLR